MDTAALSVTTHPVEFEVKEGKRKDDIVDNQCTLNFKPARLSIPGAIAIPLGYCTRPEIMVFLKYVRDFLLT